MDSLSIVWALMISLLQLNAKVEALTPKLPDIDSISALAWFSTNTVYWDTAIVQNTPAEPEPESDTGYYEKEVCDGCPVMVNPIGKIAEYRSWKVNRALKQVVRPKPVDIRKVGVDVCPNDGGVLRLSQVACPEGRSGCDVIHWAYICEQCGGEWYYKGDPP